MTYKVLNVIFLTFILALGNVAYVFADNKEKDKALIVYENQKTFSYNENVVNHLNELLYRFNNQVDNVYINDYKADQINNYNSVFVINVENQITNNEFIKDLNSYNDKIYWVGNRVQDLLYNNKKYNLEYDNQTYNIKSLIYKGKEVLVNGDNKFNLVKYTDKNVEVLSTMKDSYNEYPYVIKDKNLYYISEYKPGQSFIFEDTLNDFYNVEKADKGKVFVRIEDVHMFRDKDKLKEIADYLYSENVPFMIALIPAYINENSGKINTLNDDKEFVETIKYMQDRGGSVVLHGYMHSLDNREISGEGYEFWDMEKDEPLKESMDIYVKNRLLSGLRICVENEIYPLAFEAPHYAMDETGYLELKKYFSTYVGQFQNNNEKFATSTFPYIIKGSKDFNTFIPENLGYVESDNYLSIDNIKDNFYKLSMVRGYTGGFFFHPYMDIDYLKELIDYFKEQDVEFFNLKDYDNTVRVDDIRITSRDGKVKASYDEKKTIENNNEDKSFNKYMKNINDIIVESISVILVIFAIIFIVFRFINRRKFKRK